MLNGLKKKSNTFAQKVHDAYNHDIRKIICITTGLIALLYKISLQFCCEFIDNNKSNICLIYEIARWVKFPASILYITHSAFALHHLIKGYRNSNGKKELVKIVGKSASLASSSIEALIMLKALHFLAGSNASTISHIRLISTILFLFIAEPITYYYTYKKYQETHKVYQDACRKGIKDTGELTKCEAELAKRKKSLIISTLTLSLSLLNFILEKKIKIATTPINLSSRVVYNFNLSVTISIIYSAVFLAIHLDKLFSQPINDDPYTELDNANHVQHGDYDNNLYNCPSM